MISHPEWHPLTGQENSPDLVLRQTYYYKSSNILYRTTTRLWYTHLLPLYTRLLKQQILVYIPHVSVPDNINILGRPSIGSDTRHRKLVVVLHAYISTAILSVPGYTHT